MTELCTIDLLIIDDFALEPMTRERDIYQLFVERTGKARTIITSNRDTANWLAVFSDPLLTQGAVGPPPAASVIKPTPLLRRRNHARA
jgi:DNA replication protein DnaC